MILSFTLHLLGNVSDHTYGSESTENSIILGIEEILVNYKDVFIVLMTNLIK